ncbi:MAG TPA: DUF1877 family protein, partial [Chloroflexota bacterium]|nr:DUF1877 family protein [Chloroflexota bacterium]
LTTSAAVGAAIEQARSVPGALLDLGESWAALHFLLTGEIPMPREEALRRGVAWDDASLENVLMGGQVTSFRSPVGAARYLAPAQVAHLAQELARITPEAFAERYDAAALAEEHIPPGPWGDDPQTQTWLVDVFRQLVEFFGAAAGAGEGVLVLLS